MWLPPGLYYSPIDRKQNGMAFYPFFSNIPYFDRNIKVQVEDGPVIRRIGLYLRSTEDNSKSNH